MAEVSQRKKIWGWFFFDWASQPYHTLLVTFIFGPYFASLAKARFISEGMLEKTANAQAQSMWLACMAIAGLIIGLGAPIMGALADTQGRRVPWIAGFSVLYVIGAAGIWYAYPDGGNLLIVLMSFAIGFIGAEYALIFINSQLPDLGSDEEIGAFSGFGFAFGYTGGLLALIIALLLIVEQSNGLTVIGLKPLFGWLDPQAREGTRFVGPFVAFWYALFMIPYFAWMRDPPKKSARGGVSAALASLMRSIRSVFTRRSLAAYLGSSMIYRDALNGLYVAGGTYASLVLDWSIQQIGIAGLVAVAVSAFMSWLGGIADRRVGPKPVIIASIIALMGVTLVIIGLSRESFWGVPLAEGSVFPDRVMFVCVSLIGGFGASLQASSRSLMSRHADPEAPTEAFGLYGLSGRATSFIAPALISLVGRISGSAPIGVVPIVVLFLIGLFLLRWVKAEGDI